MTCKQCGANVELSGDRHWLHCHYCDAIFVHADRDNRMDLPGPESFDIQVAGRTLEIRWAPSRPLAVVAVTFGVSLMAFCALFTIMGGCFAPLMALFVLPFALGAAALLFYGGAAMVNRSLIAVGPREIRHRTGPIPVGGNYALATSTVEQVYCRAHVIHGKHGTVHTFEVLAVVNGQRKTLIGRLLQAEDALWLEKRIEDHLAISNRDVPGEAPLRDVLGVE